MESKKISNDQELIQPDPTSCPQKACLRKNNSKKAYMYQLVKNLTTEKQDKSRHLQDKSRKCLTKEQKFLIGGQSTVQTYTIMRLMGTNST